MIEKFEHSGREHEELRREISMDSFRFVYLGRILVDLFADSLTFNPCGASPDQDTTAMIKITFISIAGRRSPKSTICTEVHIRRRDLANEYTI